MKNILIGLIFSAFWASAAVATKYGLLSAPPLILSNVRFFLAGLVLLLFSYTTQTSPGYRLPQKQEWGQLSLFAFLNTTVYLGIYVIAMKYTAAGIGSLAVSINPLLITLLSAVYLKRLPSVAEVLSILLGIIGVVIAAFPLLQSSESSVEGLILLFASMLAVSAASVYYASVKWDLPNLLINGWQVFLGGVFLLPFTIAFSDFDRLIFDSRFVFSVLWLCFAVSVLALICWFYLLRIDTVKASLWLFLCPLFGFFFAWWFMDEGITFYTIAGTVLVIAALFIGQQRRFRRA